MPLRNKLGYCFHNIPREDIPDLRTSLCLLLLYVGNCKAGHTPLKLSANAHISDSWTAEKYSLEISALNESLS